ncbi:MULTISPECIES: NAD-dependent epimerase/dehydratase family protein [unclassified Photorhabdus]|uniref:NAD-dependent epimerase/dehydratase family protein n=1 Tax=unclassified Photorhabdus TaxID=2620880 RepID=UPI000DCB5EF4|nr:MULTISPECIES: NAD-dependent epimerase/dehydratase [unclassified Photorhabdus]RAW98437.1 paratose synthase [Photorhabdus sp. S10-54]RAW98551.1 paratose synthase [Photorhabdus sp. S9-53]RAX02752.1 paratose synthase [Photorhabdus sp. S8-52]
MRILITGISGYLGSQLANAFIPEHEVAGTIRTNSSLIRLSCVDKVQLINLDDTTKWCDAVQSFSPDIVINTAALYGRKNEQLQDLINANFTFPIILLECLGKERAYTFINCGTSLPPEVSAYALTKNQFVDLAKYLTSTGLCKFINARLEHFFGPFDDITKFTTYVFHQCIRNLPLKLTAGTQLRDFIYIKDLIGAFQILISNLDKISNGQSLDIGSGLAIPVRTFVEAVAAKTHSRSSIEFGALPMRENELMYSCAKIEILSSLGWHPQFSLENAVNDMIEKERI